MQSSARVTAAEGALWTSFVLVSALSSAGCSCQDESKLDATRPDAAKDSAVDSVVVDARDARTEPDAVDPGIDGPLAGSCGPTAWSKHFGGSSAEASFGDERGRAVTLAKNGDLVVTGYYEGDADFGGGARPAGGDNRSMLIARFAPSGDHVWSKGFGDSSSGLLFAPQVTGTDLAFDAQEHVIVVGSFAGNVDFGGGILSSDEGIDLTDAGLDDAGLAESGLLDSGLLGGCIFTCEPDAVVVKLDGDGNHVWSKRFGGELGDAASGVAIDAQGALIVVGSLHGDVDFGLGATADLGQRDAFVTKLGADGQPIWVRRFGGARDDAALGVVVDGQGAVLIAGSFQGSLALDGVTLSSAADSDAFVVKLDRDGNAVWGKALGASQHAFGLGIAVDTDDELAVVGAFRGEVDLGLNTQSFSDDAFVWKLAPGGELRWFKAFGGSQNDEADAVAIGPSKRVFVTGVVSGPVDFGGGELDGFHSDDLFLASYSSDGQHDCSRRYRADDGSSSGLGLAIDPTGDALVTGALGGTVDLGAGPISSGGGQDVLLARFSH
jgi:hypothetical protein